MDQPLRLRVKIGESEFDAEGPAESVREQYSLFVEALRRAPMVERSQESPMPPRLASPSGADGERVGEGTTTAATAAALRHTDEKGDTARAFLQRDGVVTLRVLPKTKDPEADALLLLLFGFRTIKGEDQVLATQLMKAARISGLQLERLDRAIAPHVEFFIRGGFKRSATYTLNNRGEAKAKEILADLFA